MSEKRHNAGFVELLVLNFIRLDELERFAERVNSSMDKFREETSQYLHHPVNIFQLLDRYYNGWMKLHDSIYSGDNREGRLKYAFTERL